MAGLLRPAPIKFPDSQHFGLSSLAVEPSGWLQVDAHGPLRYRRVAFSGGVFHPDIHKGLDIGTPIGTPLQAPESGIVRGHGIDANGSLYIVLEIRPGTVTMMGHLSSFVAPVGAHVAHGQVIAKSGASGHVAAHCHWEVRYGFADHDWHNWFGWFAYSPNRLLVGGDLAGAAWLKPV